MSGWGCEWVKVAVLTMISHSVCVCPAECPQCHMRYDLARGGCIHFKCTRCPNEFCSGCGESFKDAKVSQEFKKQLLFLSLSIPPPH